MAIQASSESSELGRVETRPSLRPARRGYPTFVAASFGHALTAMLRQQRLILAAVIAFLPVLLPLAMAFLSRSKYADEGLETFVRMIEYSHISALSPLLALFFATMLVGGDVEAQTIPYVLTRPIPRSAWVLGRFMAYLVVTVVLLVVSVLLTFAACTTLADFLPNASNLKLMLHYDGVIALSLLAYGAVTVFLGAVTRRPIIIGVVLIYGWQPVARAVPGLIDFFTVSKYVSELLPRLATEPSRAMIQTNLLGEFQKRLFLIGATKAALMLVVITALFLGLTIVTVRVRQYASAHAVGG